MRIPALLLSILLTACGGADQSRKPLLDEAMRTEIEQFRLAQRLPGLSVVLVDADRIESFATGVRSLGSAEPLQAGDRLEVGSLSKAMTGSLIARLVEQKKLRWDSTLGELFPAWRDGMHPQFGSVTIEQLLQHRSGLPYDFAEEDVRALLPLASGDAAQDRAAAARYFLQRAPQHAPGSAYLYSNLGYIVLGLVAEAKGGDAYRNLMAREVFGPLQLAAEVGMPVGAPLAASGHVFGDAGWRPAHPGPDDAMWLAMTEAAGGIRVSMHDYGLYLQEQLKGIAGRPAFLAQASFERAHALEAGYAHGWGVAHNPQLGRVSQHNGSNGSYFSIALVLRDRDRALAISCNCYSPQAMAEIEAFAGRLAAASVRSQ
ncbi:serine hydrolase domain-containing protein [Pseudoduganella sp.]|uniref:serine hydrolase domain-containing protein n=1 Tax=Pseudoduganella sp. TaxID=1880898 RepID=UPI0035ADE6AE